MADNDPVKAAEAFAELLMPKHHYYRFKCTAMADLDKESDHFVELMEHRLVEDFIAYLHACPNPAAFMELGDWRNSIRTILHFSRFKVDFSSIWFEIEYKNGKSSQQYELMAPGQEIMEMDVLHHLVNRPEVESVAFIYELDTGVIPAKEAVFNRHETRAFFSFANGEIETGEETKARRRKEAREHERQLTKFQLTLPGPARKDRRLAEELMVKEHEKSEIARKSKEAEKFAIGATPEPADLNYEGESEDDEENEGGEEEEEDEDMNAGDESEDSQSEDSSSDEASNEDDAAVQSKAAAYNG